MNLEPAMVLIINAALLMAVVLIYDNVATGLISPEIKAVRGLVSGLLLGSIGIAVMLIPWEFSPGIHFDTRSVLLSLAGLFYGPLPTLTACTLTAAWRLWQGGAGAWTGVSVIIVSGLIGIFWRRIRYQNRSLETISWGELLLFGYCVHVTMLILMLSLPWAIALQVLSAITLPVLTVYPLATLILAALFINSLRRREHTNRLAEREQRLLVFTLMFSSLLDKLKRKNLYLDMLNATSLSLMKRMSLDEIFQNIVAQAASFFQVAEAWVSVLEPDGERMTIRAMTGPNVHLTGTSFSLKRGVAGEVVRTNAAVIIEDYRLWEGRVNKSEYRPRRAIIGVPLRYEYRIAGVLCLAHHTAGQSFTSEDQEMLERMAELANIALDNSRLYERMMQNLSKREEADKSLVSTTERLRKMLGGTVQAISMAVETKDPYTAGHQRRTADLARAIAAEMGLPPERTDFIRIAASIHDIGKIAIPAEILSKPTPLSEIEFGIIKTHAAQGYEILKDIDFPWPVAEVILQHHERMNGSGYPRGLKGDKILPAARILMVADTVEAIASHRPYRPMLGIEAALAELNKNRGILYDEEVVDICILLFRSKDYLLV